MAMNRSIAQRDDHLGLIEDRIARRKFESRLVDQRGDIVLVGQLQRTIKLVGPGHSQF